MKWKQIWRVTFIVILAILMGTFFRSYLFASYVVDGKSMEPTLYDGNLLMVNKVVYDLQEVDRFDVIVFHANKKEDYVKRVIGIPGDEIAYRNDQFNLNGKQVEESYLEPFKKNDGMPLTKDFTLKEITGRKKVPEGKLFVMGDNRRDSMDSRAFGFVSAETVVGKVDVRYWPVSQVGLQF